MVATGALACAGMHGTHIAGRTTGAFTEALATKALRILRSACVGQPVAEDMLLVADP